MEKTPKTMENIQFLLTQVEILDIMPQRRRSYERYLSNHSRGCQSAGYYL